MKLLKCYVSSFGKIQDFTYDFSDGLNTLKEENGWGKSTLATFIKAMFYGLNGLKRSVSDNERLKFKPWNQTSSFGGYVEFEWGQNHYKIERYFGSKESEDSIKLYDLKTGRLYANTENLGKRIFQIDEEGFLSTTFFSQKDFQAKSNTSLTAKYNAVCEAEDSERFDKALLKVEEKAKTYKYRGDKGLISQEKAKLFNLNEEIERVKTAENTANLLRGEIKDLEEKTEAVKSQAGIYAEKVAKAGKIEANNVKKERLAELKKERLESVEKYNNLDAFLGGKNISSETVNGYYNCVEELSGISKAQDIIREEINSLEQKIEIEKKPKKSKKGVIALVCGIAILIFSIVGFIINLLIGIGIGSVGALLTVIGAIFSLSESKKDDPNAIYRSMLEEKKKQEEQYFAISNDYNLKLSSFARSFGYQNACDYKTLISKVLSAIEERKQQKEKIIQLDNAIEQISTQLLGEEEQGKENFNLNELKQKLLDAQNLYSQKASLLASKKASLKSYIEQVERLSDLESKKAEITERIEEYKNDYEILNLTAEYLKKANDNLKTKYKAPLENSLNKYFALVTGGEKKVKIDIDLSVTVLETSGEKAVDYYSKGYQNLFEICKRFALTDVLFTGEKPFIILDDPFFNLDDEKLKKSLDLIKELAKEYQIIYFVCHESRRA